MSLLQHTDSVTDYAESFRLKTFVVELRSASHHCLERGHPVGVAREQMEALVWRRNRQNLEGDMKQSY